ncbi:MAG TPA: rod shape-determining protein MreD [Candidatus Baltobacteraceae bacterium]
MYAQTKSAPDTPFVGPPWWLAAIWLLAALLFQLIAARWFMLREAVPSALLVAVVYYAMRVDMRRAGVYGLIAGLCADLLGGTGGAWTIASTLTAIGVGALSRLFFADSLLLAASMAAVATLVRDAIFWIVRSAQGYPAGLAGLHFHQTLWQALLDAVLIAVVILLTRWRENYRTR